MFYITSSNSVKGVRETNQDSHSTVNVRGVKVLLVADGNGEGDARLFSEEVLKKCMGEISYALSRRKGKIEEAFLKEAGISAIRNVSEYATMLKMTRSSLARCGSTLTLVFIYNRTVLCLWVGDSPAVLIKNGGLTRLASPPHTLKELLLSEGGNQDELSAQEISSVLTRCIGHRDNEPGVRSVQIDPPYMLIAGSDGMGNLSDREIMEIVRRDPFDINLADKIISESLRKGSDDNVTVLTSLVMDGFASRKPVRKRKRWRALLC